MIITRQRVGICVAGVRQPLLQRQQVGIEMLDSFFRTALKAALCQAGLELAGVGSSTQINFQDAA